MVPKGSPPSWAKPRPVFSRRATTDAILESSTVTPIVFRREFGALGARDDHRVALRKRYQLMGWLSEGCHWIDPSTGEPGTVAAWLLPSASTAGAPPDDPITLIRAVPAKGGTGDTRRHVLPAPSHQWHHVG